MAKKKENNKKVEKAVKAIATEIVGMRREYERRLEDLADFVVDASGSASEVAAEIEAATGKPFRPP